MVSPIAGRKAIIAKVGMDAHWRGAIVVANALRDAGMEVVYLGHATPTEVAAVALQEDAALVGLSCLSGNHLEQVPPVVAALRAIGADHVSVIVGGAIPEGDVPALSDSGVAAVVSTGATLSDVVAAAERTLAR